MNLPEGFHTVTPHLILKDAREALEIYKKVFNAEQRKLLLCPESGKVIHAELKIEDSIIFISDENPQLGNVSSMGQNLYMYVDDVEKYHNRALENGLIEKEPVSDTFLGDRVGRVTDPYGIVWCFAKRMREPSEEEMLEFIKERTSKAA
jgi:uncharacterized glyoxalase superfamily protein PhnB